MENPVLELKREMHKAYSRPTLQNWLIKAARQPQTAFPSRFSSCQQISSEYSDIVCVFHN